MWQAIVGSAAVSGLLGSKASKDSAAAAREAADQAARGSSAASASMRRDLAPWRDVGGSALQRLARLTGVGGGVNSSDPRFKSIYDSIVSQHDGEHQKKFGISIFDGRAGLSAAGERERFDDMVKSQAERQYAAQFGEETPAEGDDFGSLLKSFSREDFEADPGYQFRLEEGEKALTRASAARGLAKSTPGLKSLMRFSSDLASQEYGAAYGRNMADKQFTFGSLQSMAGMGQNAAAMTGTAGINSAAAAGNATMAGGQAAAQGIMGSASSMNNAIQGGLGNYLTMQRFDEMMKRMPVFGGGTTTTTAPGMNWNMTGSFPAMGMQA